jgi:hypothetical protein
MVKLYWRRHRIADIGLSIITSSLIWTDPLGIVWTSVENDPSYFRSLAGEWFSASSALFGLVAATIAFVFGVVDLKEYAVLRRSRSSKQLWEIFTFALTVLLVTSVWTAIIAILRERALRDQAVQATTLLLAVLTTIQMLKFTWVVCAIVSVKASGTRMNESKHSVPEPPPGAPGANKI